jgi:hypothetical protein
MPIKLDGFTPEALADLEALGAHMGKEDQPIFENLLQKNPKAAREIIDGRLRQSDYDKNMNLSKAEVAAAKKRAQDMQEWYDRNEPLHKKALGDLTSLEEQKQALEAKYTKQAEEFAALAASKGGEGVDEVALAAAIKSQVEKFGYVTQDEFNKIKLDTLQAQVEKAADDRIKAAEDKLFKETMPAIWNSSMDLAEIAVEHKAEFGEKLDRNAFSTFLTEKKITDSNEGYKAFVADRRGEREFKKRVDEEVKQKLSGMQLNGNGSGSGTPTLMERGVLQQKIDEENKSASSTSAAAMAAAAELRSEGKF